MRNFYALWPAGKIYPTVSVKSLTPPISQTASGKLKRHEKNDTQNYETLSRNLTLIDISDALLLSWSADIHLLAENYKTVLPSLVVLERELEKTWLMLDAALNTKR